MRAELTDIAGQASQGDMPGEAGVDLLGPRLGEAALGCEQVENAADPFTVAPESDLLGLPCTGEQIVRRRDPGPGGEKIAVAGVDLIAHLLLGGAHRLFCGVGLGPGPRQLIVAGKAGKEGHLQTQGSVVDIGLALSAIKPAALRPSRGEYRRQQSGAGLAHIGLGGTGAGAAGLQVRPPRESLFHQGIDLPGQGIGRDFGDDRRKSAE